MVSFQNLLSNPLSWNEAMGFVGDLPGMGNIAFSIKARVQGLRNIE